MNTTCTDIILKANIEPIIGANFANWSFILLLLSILFFYGWVYEKKINRNSEKIKARTSNKRPPIIFCFVVSQLFITSSARTDNAHKLAMPLLKFVRIFLIVKLVTPFLGASAKLPVVIHFFFLIFASIRLIVL